MHPLGIEPVCIDAYKPDTLKDDIMKLGYMYCKVEGAERLWNFWEDYYEILHERTKDLLDYEKPKVYFEYWWKWATITSANEGWWHRAIEMAGGRNIAAELSDKPYVTVDPEYIAMKDPDFIIKVIYKPKLTLTDLLMTREEIMSIPELKGVAAVVNNATYAINSEISTAGPDGMISALFYAKIFHPNKFADLNPRKIYEVYLKEFLGVELPEGYYLIYPTP